MEGHSVANENQIFAMLDFNPSISHLEQQGITKLFLIIETSIKYRRKKYIWRR